MPLVSFLDDAEGDVGEQGRENPALRHAGITSDKAAFRENTGLRPTPSAHRPPRRRWARALAPLRGPGAPQGRRGLLAEALGARRAAPLVLTNSVECDSGHYRLWGPERTGPAHSQGMLPEK
jgi:hypothetical protein